jgi:hypothetical protein
MVRRATTRAARSGVPWRVREFVGARSVICCRGYIPQIRQRTGCAMSVLGPLTTDWQSLLAQSSCRLHPKADLRLLGRRLTTWPGTQAKRQSSCMIAAIIPARLRSRVALRGVDRDQRTISALMLAQRYANAVTIWRGRYRRAETAPLGARLRVRVSAT